MDALSELLQLIRLKSSVYFKSDFGSPWGMEILEGPFAQFHIIVRGSCLLKAKGEKEPVTVSAGDIVVFPFGKAHWLADDTGRELMPGKIVVSELLNKRPVFQTGKIKTTIICGHFEFERNLDHPFIESLPQIIHITDMERRELSWLEIVASLIMQETDSGKPGAGVVVNRLAEVLFIHVIRAYMMMNSNISHGFIRALIDKKISIALKAIHDVPQQRWTLEMLAKKAGMSRTLFINRFKEMVGMPPMQYIYNWRMLKAQDLLRNDIIPLDIIAEKVGYTSMASFNRAFKKKFKKTPGVYRKGFLS